MMGRRGRIRSRCRRKRTKRGTGAIAERAGAREIVVVIKAGAQVPIVAGRLE